MRKSLSIILVGLSVYASARQISPDEAMSAASDFLSSSELRTAVSANSTLSLMKAPGVDKNTAVNPYYIFNRGDNDGFVIISSDDRAPKILGYSDKGKFDFNNLPPQLSAMLEQYSEQISSLTATSPDPSWSSNSRAISEGEGKLLETANWGQSYPYNAQCPVIDGVQCPTGCVATAMAIVMKYHNWPEGYDWDAMPMSMPENPMESLSSLMSDAGDAVYMNYSPYESGANMNWVGHRLQNRFKYSPECQYISSANFSYNEWVTLLKNNLDNDEPVIYGGTDLSNSLSHAFIIDGYKDDLYHINWGWDGVCNGYFILSALTPNESHNFSSDASMVINILPDKSGMEYSEVFCDFGYFWSTYGLLPGCFISKSEVNNQQSFDFSTPTYTLYPGFKGHVGIGLVDENNVIKEVIKTTDIITTWSDNENKYVLEGNDMTFLDCVIKQSVDPNDKIQLIAKDINKSENEWKLVLGTIEASSYVRISDLTPSLSTISFSVGQGCEVKYQIQYGDLHNTQNNDKVEVVKGASICIHASNISGNPGVIVISRKGKGIYGDENTVSGIDNMADPFQLYGDSYVIEVKLIETGTEKRINITEPGSLYNIVTEEEALSISSMYIDGKMNACDFWYIRDKFANLEQLDLRNVQIFGCETTDTGLGNTELWTYYDDELPHFAFWGQRHLKQIQLPEQLKGIGDLAMSAIDLETLELPSNITQIGANAFSDNPNLECVVYNAVAPAPILQCVFDGTKCPHNGVLYIPEGSLQTYLESDIWKEFSQIVEGIIDISKLNITVDGIKYKVKGTELTIVGYDQSELPSEIIIPAKIDFDNREYKVTEIAEKAFECINAESIKVGYNVRILGEFSFSGCSVDHIELPEGLTKIPFACFSGASMKDINLPESLKVIGNAFQGCYNLETLYIPANAIREYQSTNFGQFPRAVSINVHPENKDMKSIDGVLFSKDGKQFLNYPGAREGVYSIPEGVEDCCVDAFSGSESLSGIIFPKSIKTIGSINNCSSIRHIELPENIYLSGNLLSNLSSLESVTINEASSGYNAFVNLSSLKNIYLLNSSIINMDEIILFIDEDDYDFAENYTYVCPKLYPNFKASKYNMVFIPGGTIKNFTKFSNEKVNEMWKYRINRHNRSIQIFSNVDGVNIENVKINGVEYKAVKNGIYEYPELGEAEVIVNYVVNDHQAMTTVYDREFNATLPDTDFLLVKDILLSSIDMTLYIGDSSQLLVTILPDNAANKTIEWSSSDENIVTVDTEGNVTAVAVGDAVITATATDGSSVSATCNVTVLPILAESIAISQESWSAHAGETVKFTATVLPENTTDKIVAWSSSDESVAVVDDNGEVTVVGVGNVVITAACGEITSECALKCYPRIGDANWNGSITVADAVDISNYVVKKKTAPEEWDEEEWLEFYSVGANANESEDGSITFADASAAVRIALSQPEAASEPNRIRSPFGNANESSDALVVGALRETNDGKTYVTVKLHNSIEYVALQADIFILDGMDVEVKAGSRAASHSLETMRFDSNHLRVAIFNLGNKAFAAGDDPVLEIVADCDMSGIEGLTISNILAADSEANEYVLGSRMGDVTGVEGVSCDAVLIEKISGGLQISNAAGKRIDICTMDGKTVKSFVANNSIEIINLPVGIYIVKAGDKNLKVIL